MNKTAIFFPLIILLTLSVFSCAVIQPAQVPADRPQPFTSDGSNPDFPIVNPPAGVTQRPPVPTFLMGQGMVVAESMERFLLMNNPRLDVDYVNVLMIIYVEEAAAEGVNHDVAFAQMCLETGYLRYGGDVQPEQFNFAGLGAIGGGEPGLSFPDPRTGVRAQIQHLKAYGSTEPLNRELVNPRFHFVRRGISPQIEGLAGTWAADRQYAVKINNILLRLYDFAF